MTNTHRRGAWQRWSMAGLGFLYFVVIGGVVATSGIEQTTLSQLQVGIPLLLSLGLVAYGWWLARSDISPRRIRHIALWSLAGTLVLGTFATWEMYTHLLEGETVVETLHEILLGTTEGAAVGGIVGYYDARRKEQYLEAEQAQQAVSASMDGIAILDEDGEYEAVNQAHAEIYGYDDPDAFVGGTWHQCYTVEEAERIETEAMPELAETGQLRGEFTGVRRDGSTFPQELTLSVRPSGGLVCIVRDVTERHEYEGRLKALNETSRQLMAAESEDAIADAIVETADQLLDQPLTAMWTYDAANDVLIPSSAAEHARELAETADPGEGLRPIRPGTVEMDVFRSGETTVIENYAETENTSSPDVPLGSLLLVPIGDYGLLNVGTPDVGAIDQSDRQLIEILRRNAHAAFDRVERAQELANREFRLRTIVENVPVILFAIDQDRELTLSVGKGLEEVGAEQNEMVGESVDDLFDNSPAVIDAVDRSLDGESVDVTVNVWNRTYQVWYQPVAAGDEVTSVIGVAMDVTERQKRERGIRALHDATREMMQETDQEAICEIAVETARQSLGLPMTAIWLRADDPPRLEPVAWSDEAERLFGALPALESGESLIWQVYESGERSVHDDLLEVPDRYNPDTAVRSELNVPLGDYGVLNSGSTDPHRFDETDVVLAQLLAANTRVALERADREGVLQRQTDQMEFFNSILRHDVLNGMTVIRGRAEFLTDDLEGDQLRDAETILDWSNDIVDIIRRVRTVLETLTSTGDPQLETVDLSVALQAELDRVVATYPEVEFVTSIPDGVLVQADELLGEIFGNVITNAVDHNETDDLRVAITVDDPDEAEQPVTVRISDNGQGVPHESKDAIFRRDETGHAKSTGSGFGLFFVDAMVAEYGGDVRVEDNEHGGADFVIELPAA